MQDALRDHDSTVYIWGRWISNLRFVDDIYLMESSSNELQKRTDFLAKSASRYEMEIVHEKSMILVNDPDPNKVNNNNLTINMYGKKREQVLHYLNILVLY